jgi:hypothetical protein
MSKINTKLDCNHEYVIGASGSGKSHYVKQRIKNIKRVLIWDSDDEYGEVSGMVKVSDPYELIQIIKNGDAVVRFVPSSMDGKFVVKCFSFVSLAAFVWGNCYFVAEEIADVTSVSKASNGWGIVLRRGRKRGVTVIGISQRPAEADKTMFTQAAKIRTGRLDGESDMQRVASNMRIDVNMLRELGALQWIELIRNTGQLRAGKKNQAVVIRKSWNDELILSTDSKK